MPQSMTFGERRTDLRPKRDSVTGEFTAPAQGDFARGQRHSFAATHATGDFATGMRSLNVSRVAGDFATGMRTLPRTTTLGDFATGMRTDSAPVVINAFPSAVSGLPAAA